MGQDGFKFGHRQATQKVVSDSKPSRARAAAESLEVHPGIDAHFELNVVRRSDLDPFGEGAEPSEKFGGVGFPEWNMELGGASREPQTAKKNSDDADMRIH